MLSRQTKAFLDIMNRPVDAAGLVCFRVGFGLLVTFSALRFQLYGWLDEFFIRPKFFFKYWGFSWVAVPERPILMAMNGALMVLGLCIAAGLFYRWAVVTFVGVFVYFQCMDATNYLNHYYLVALLAFLMAFMPLGDAASVDAWRRPAVRRSQVPAWTLYLLRAQVGIVYGFAGLAKASTDWLLHAQPLQIWLAARTHLPLVGVLFDQPWVAHAFAWAGFLFDTTIVAFLLWPRARPWAYAVVLFFHAMTSLLFPIGMFPVIMVLSALVFFPPDWPRLWMRLFFRGAKSRDAGGPVPGHAAGVSSRNAYENAAENSSGNAAGALRPRGLWCIGLYLLVQLLLPLRHHLYGGNVAWHEQGMRLAWKVMVREKNGSVTYLVEDPETGRTQYVNPREVLDARQAREFAAQPDQILQLAHHLGRRERARRGHEVRVRVEAYASLNGRSPALLVDPGVNLLEVDDGWLPADWIRPAPSEPPPHLHGLGKPWFALWGG